MKKFLFIPIFMLIAQSLFAQGLPPVMNTKKADTTAIFFRASRSSGVAFAGPDYSVPLDTLRKLVGMGKPAAAAKHLYIKAGANQTLNTVTLVSGVATVANTSVTANSEIILYLKTQGGTSGNFYVLSSKTAGTGFAVKAIGLTGATVTTDTGTLGYLILN